MPKVGPLPAQSIRDTLVVRFGPLADRLRQLNTRFGTRARRVFLVWVQSVGEDEGGGSDVEVARVELLPTPRVSDATTLTRRPLHVTVVAEGSLRVDQISVAAFTEDNLRGLRVPRQYADQDFTQPNQSVLVGGTPAAPVVQSPWSFYYEIVEDGRGDQLSARTRYKLGAAPWRHEAGLQWSILLEPMSGGADRVGDVSGTADDVLDVQD